MDGFFIILYVDDVVLFSYSLDYMLYFINVLETFNQINGLTVNMDDTKLMAIKAIKGSSGDYFALLLHMA